MKVRQNIHTESDVASFRRLVRISYRFWKGRLLMTKLHLYHRIHLVFMLPYYYNTVTNETTWDKPIQKTLVRASTPSPVPSPFPLTKSFPESNVVSSAKKVSDSLSSILRNNTRASSVATSSNKSYNDSSLTEKYVK